MAVVKNNVVTLKGISSYCFGDFSFRFTPLSMTGICKRDSSFRFALFGMTDAYENRRGGNWRLRRQFPPLYPYRAVVIPTARNEAGGISNASFSNA
jgi:hypothetical protein